MAKYSYEFKMKIVQEYLNGEGGYKFLSIKHGVPSTKDIRIWIAAYNTFGSDGLLRKRKNEIYSFEFKLSVVELYLTTEVSYRELALSVGINNPTLITRWVNDFRIVGPDALKPKQRGRVTNVPKPKDTPTDLQNTSNNSAEYIKQIEGQLLKLRIENAYLKELRRLRLEEIALNKKRELSTAFEENSD